MSLAEMTRIKVPRTVKTSVSRRPPLALPRAAYLGSVREWPASGATRIGRLKKHSSASLLETRRSSQFLSVLPLSHSKPTHSDRSSGNPAIHRVYYQNIHCAPTQLDV